MQLDPNSIKNGFRKCGLSPFDANNVDYFKCVTSHPKKPAKAYNDSQIQPDAVGNFFELFESQISPENLEAFYSNEGPIWKGDKSLEGLFHVWRQIKSQNNLPSSQPAQETLFNNFTGLTDILDSNLNSHDFSDLMAENESPTGKIEVYENVDGTLMKIIDVEVPTNEASLTNFVKEDFFCPENETRKRPHLSGQVIRTIGSNPIYITPLKNITTNAGITSTPISLLNAETMSNLVDTDSSIQPSLLATTNSIAELVPIQTQLWSTMTQTSFGSKELVPITPPSKISPILSEEVNATTTIPDETTPDYTQININISENMKTPPRTLIAQAIPDDDNRNQPKTKYYGDLVVPTPFKDALFWPETPSISTRTKVKQPSVITCDRWQIFAQNKLEAKTKKEENKVKAKEKRNKKLERGCDNKKLKKKVRDTGASDIANEDWFCRLCQRSTKLDMIQCVTCKTWYHTICAEVSPNEITFTCIYCNVSFDE